MHLPELSLILCTYRCFCGFLCIWMKVCEWKILVYNSYIFWIGALDLFDRTICAGAKWTFKIRKLYNSHFCINFYGFKRLILLILTILLKCFRIISADICCGTCDLSVDNFFKCFKRKCSSQEAAIYKKSWCSLDPKVSRLLCIHSYCSFFVSGLKTFFKISFIEFKILCV